MEQATKIITSLIRNRRERLRFAIQKDGRLFALAWGILTACVEACSGTMPERKPGDRRAVIRVDSMPKVEIILLRNAEIPQYVENGSAEAAVVGEDQVLEQESRVTTAARLGEARCSLQLMTSDASSIRSAQDLRGKKVATSFPVLTKKFLAELGISPKEVTQKKSVEAAIASGGFDAGFDLVDSGESMRANNLRSVAVIKNFEAILITK
jgi:ATP phosphoribosyltransferase